MRLKLFLFIAIAWSVFLPNKEAWGQRLWLRADVGVDVTTLFDSVSVWTDQSGNNHNATALGTRRPIFTLGPNYTNVIYFGGNQFFDIPYSSNLNPSQFSMFIVTRIARSGFISPFTTREGLPPRGFSLYLDNGNFEFWTGDGSSWQVASTGSSNDATTYDIITLRGATSGSNLDKRVYRNGAQIGSTITQGYLPNQQRPTRIGAGATETTNGNYSINGYIGEVILYDSALSDIEREKIETYLGIKYGLHIEHDYINRAGSTIFTAGSYNNHIAAIGRDNVWQLHTKVSSSESYSPTLSGGYVISTNRNFGTTNSDSSRPALSDGQFVIMGHNNGSLSTWQTEGTTRRLGRRWKIVNTGNVSSIGFQIYMQNVATALGVHKIAIDNDEDISNGTISTHSLEHAGSHNYNTTITLPQGTSYLTIIDSSDPVQRMWLRADSGTNTTTDEEAISVWEDYSTNDIDATQTAPYLRPTYETDGINFNPTIEFDGRRDILEQFDLQSLGYGAASRTTFLVARDNGTAPTQWSMAWSYGNSGSRQAWGVGRYGTSARYLAINVNSSYIIYGSWGNRSRLLTAKYDGTSMHLYQEGGSLFSRTEVLSTQRSQGRVGAQTRQDSESWGGYISEIIHYNGTLPTAERHQIESYLAIKYGITLQHNYRSSDNNVVYTVASYSNDILGIAADDEYGLDQKVSSSDNITNTTGSNITIATTNDFVSSNLANNRTSLANDQFLIMGHNNGGTSSWIDSGNYKRLARFWKAQNTGNVGTVFFQINTNGYPQEWRNYYLLVDNDTNLSNGITSSHLLSNSSGDLHSTSLSFPSGVSYFTIGFEVPDVDYGDAPASYSTLESANGAKHVIVSGTQLGASISADSDGFSDGTDSNNNASDDSFDDGVVFNPSLATSGVNLVHAGANTLRVTTSIAGYLSVWIDSNADGDFLDSSEQLFNDRSVSSGQNDLAFTINANLLHRASYVRVRFTTVANRANTPTGVAPDGEVEDYQVQIISERSTNSCANRIVNGSFEQPDITATSSVDHNQIMGWNSSTNVVDLLQTQAVSGVESQDGNQLAELNTTGATSYYQHISTTPGESLTWRVYHRGLTGSNQARLKIGTPTATTIIANLTTTTSWQLYTGTYVVPSGQYLTRFEIESVTPNSAGGNLLDNIHFQTTDTELPTITCSNQNVIANNSGCTYLVSGTAFNPVATDNCTSVTLSHDYDGGGATLDGKSFPLGTTTVNWTATDLSSNTSNCSMTVTVTNNMSATIATTSGSGICMGEEIVFNATATSGTAPYTYNFRIGSTSQQSGSQSSFTTTSLTGSSNLDVVITDNNGCSATSNVLTITTYGNISTNAIQVP